MVFILRRPGQPVNQPYPIRPPPGAHSNVAVRIDSGDFGSAAAELAAHYSRNIGSTRTDEFAAFEDETRTPHLGIQLTTKGGVFDVFHCFADALRTDAELLRRYNLLKIGYDGRPMDQYRAAKDAFVMEVLRLINGQLGAITDQLL